MAKKSKWKGAALSLLGSIPFAGKVKKGIKAAKKAAKTLQKKAQTTKKKVKASLKKAKNKGKKKKKKKKKKGKVFTKARKLMNNLSKEDMLKKLKKGMNKTVLAAKKIQKKAVKYVKSGKFLNHVQLGLDVVGMIPVAGTVAGVANAGISAARGNFAGAALDLVSCIPGVGTVTKGGKLAIKATKAAKTLKSSEKAATVAKKLEAKAKPSAGKQAKAVQTAQPTKVPISSVPKKNASVSGTGRGQPSKTSNTGAKGTGKIDKTYDRPSGYRKGVRDEVWEKAKGADGEVRDPVSGQVMNKDEPWDMGHKPGYEFRKHQESAQERGISRKEFLDEHNNPDHYRPELPSSNRSHKGEDLTDDYFGD